MIDFTLPYAKTEAKRIIREYYADHPTKVIALVVGWSVSQIYHYAYSKGLKKSETFHAELMRIEAERITKRGERYRFTKGHTPANKGKKMKPEVYLKAQPTMFKKGNKPHNYMPVGSEAITKDGYVKVKIADPNKWELKHRLVWEQHNGPIPKGYNVQFKDGNRANTCITNLYLISKSDQISDNSIVRYPPELRRAIHRVSKLKKTIKQYETD